MKSEIAIYNILLANIKSRVRQGQLKANLAANAEMLATYWDIGRFVEYQNGISIVKLSVSQLMDGAIWQLPDAELKSDAIVQPPVAQLPNNPIMKLAVSQLESVEMQLITKVGWAHLPTKEEIEKELMNTNDTEDTE